MTVYNFRPAVASEAKPLVGVYAESGTGKTKSALLLAKGFTGDMSKVGMIETESGRGEAYARDPVVGGYSVLPLREDFSPKAYGAAIAAAEKAGLQALIIDSASHEWEGVGGVLDQAAKKKAAGAKGVLVWQEAKIDHKREFMLRLMQTPIPLVIVCMRAKYPMKEATAEDIERIRAAGKKPPQSKGDWFRSDRLEPTQADDILFEMFVHGWIDHEHCFHVTKYTVDELRDVFLEGQRVTVETGQRLAAWAGGRAVVGGFITPDQVAHLETRCQDEKIEVRKLREKIGVERLAQIPAADYPRAMQWIDKVIEARSGART